jgi:hypothetical protein
MLPLLIPVVVGLVGTTAYKVHKKKTALSPQKKMILDTALNSNLQSADYLKLADAFDAEGLKAEATLLRNRAALKDATPEQQKAYKAAFKKAFSCEDPKLVDKMADAFAGKGAVGAAADLRKYAQGLRDGTASPTTTQTQTTGTGGPSMVTVPPAIIPTPTAVTPAVAATTATPTVTQSTGATVTPGNQQDPMAQGATSAEVPPAVVIAPTPAVQSTSTQVSTLVAAGLVAPSAAAAVPTQPVSNPSIQSPSNVTAKIDAAAQAAVIQATLDAAVGQASTPTVVQNAGSATATPTNLTTPMGQGTPQQ